jgi:hypothetical protein
MKTLQVYLDDIAMGTITLPADTDYDSVLAVINSRFGQDCWNRIEIVN